MVTQNGQSIETGKCRSHKTKNKNQAKTKKPNKVCVGHHYPQANTNNVNKTCTFLQTTGGKDEPMIVCMRKSQHRTQSVIIGQHKTLTR